MKTGFLENITQIFIAVVAGVIVLIISNQIITPNNQSTQELPSDKNKVRVEEDKVKLPNLDQSNNILIESVKPNKTIDNKKSTQPNSNNELKPINNTQKEILLNNSSDKSNTMNNLSQFYNQNYTNNQKEIKDVAILATDGANIDYNFANKLVSFFALKNLTSTSLLFKNEFINSEEFKTFIEGNDINLRLKSYVKFILFVEKSITFTDNQFEDMKTASSEVQIKMIDASSFKLLFSESINMSSVGFSISDAKVNLEKQVIDKIKSLNLNN